MVALLVAAVVVLAGAAANARAGFPEVSPAEDGSVAVETSGRSLEWVGVTEPWTTAHHREVAEGLGIDVPPPGSASRAAVVATPATVRDSVPIAVPSAGTNGAHHGRP